MTKTKKANWKRIFAKHLQDMWTARDFTYMDGLISIFYMGIGWIKNEDRARLRFAEEEDINGEDKLLGDIPPTHRDEKTSSRGIDEVEEQEIQTLKALSPIVERSEESILEKVPQKDISREKPEEQ